MNGNATTSGSCGTTMTNDTVIGLELGVRKSRACVLRRSGVIEEIVMPSTKAGLRGALESLERCRVFMEVGPTSPWVSRFLTELGFDAVVIVPSTLKELLGKRQKSDRDDALGLARLGARCPDLLRRVTHRSEVTQRRMALLRMRDGLVRARTLLVNEVRGVLAALGVPAPPCSARAFARRAWDHLSPEDRLLVRSPPSADHRRDRRDLPHRARSRADRTGSLRHRDEDPDPARRSRQDHRARLSSRGRRSQALQEKPRDRQLSRNRAAPQTERRSRPAAVDHQNWQSLLATAPGALRPVQSTYFSWKDPPVSEPLRVRGSRRRPLSPQFSGNAASVLPCAHPPA